MIAPLSKVQKEFNRLTKRIDQSHLENLAEDQLRYYNKLLKEQARDLDEALYLEQVDLSRFTGKPWYYTTTPASMDKDYQLMKRSIEQKIKDITADEQDMRRNPTTLKAFLKAYKIPKQRPGPMMIRL